MKKIIALSCMTAVLLAGCGRTGQSSSDTSKATESATTAAQTTAADTTAEDTTAEEITAAVTDPPATTHEANVSAGGIMDMYPAIYQGFIRDEFERTSGENNGIASIEFGFRDLDADGIPELIFKRGTCEADFAINIYTLDSEGEIKDLGLIGGGHTVFGYDENSADLVIIWGHMGAGSLEYFKMENGAVVKAQDSYDFDLGQDNSYEDVLREKGVRHMEYVSAYKSGLDGEVKSWFYHADGTAEEFDGLYLDYMG